jgi:hypothetical protein
MYGVQIDEANIGAIMDHERAKINTLMKSIKGVKPNMPSANIPQYIHFKDANSLAYGYLATTTDTINQVFDCPHCGESMRVTIKNPADLILNLDELESYFISLEEIRDKMMPVIRQYKKRTQTVTHIKSTDEEENKEIVQAEWDEEKNKMTAYEISAGNNFVGAWKCQICGESYKCRVSDRIFQNKCGCIKCRKSKKQATVKIKDVPSVTLVENPKKQQSIKEISGQLAMNFFPNEIQETKVVIKEKNKLISDFEFCKKNIDV